MSRVVAAVGLLLLATCAAPTGFAEEEVLHADGWSVRIRRFEEVGFMRWGSHYRFESRALGSERWTPIFSFRHDDSVAIPVENVRFEGRALGWVYMGWRYAVTTDAGRTWASWSAADDLPGWWGANYDLIESVTLEADGSGLMMCNPIPGRGEAPELYTNDFGRTWSKVPPRAESGSAPRETTVGLARSHPVAEV